MTAPPTSSTNLGAALTGIAAAAEDRDQTPGVPPFPAAAFSALRAAGALELPARLAAQLAVVRAVSAADGSVGRILDGHLNALERLAVHGIAAQNRLHGVWGANPGPGEGEPAWVDGEVLRGVKTFCSGAGGVERALVIAGDRLVYVDTTDGTRVDEGWYRSSGLRASCSHRVEFDGAPVLAVLGEPGEILRAPWFARDATRTTATWAGLADTAAASALALLAARPQRTALEELAAGRIESRRRTIDLWLGAAACDEEPSEDDAIHLRDAVATAIRALVDEALRACGSRPLVTAHALDRARRDLEVFLLQHRLDPLVARAGGRLLDAADPA